ncbi:hypothetical protein PG984_003533 [Apiospora sp. TS-2023a]
MAQELCRSVQVIASTFSPNRVPVVFRDSQIGTISRARERQLPSLNEFRQTMGLPTYKKIEDISSSPLVAAKLRSLYSHPGEIELYPGVIAEEPPPKAVFAAAVVSKWLCTGSTVAHAVVRDTVALIRDDPFYTDEWSPRNVTSWGFREPASDENVSYGCVMHKLILRAFPKQFAPDSVYVHFPFVIPEGNRVILAELRSDASYSFEAKPGRPAEPTQFGVTAISGLAHPHGRPVDLTGTLQNSKHMLQKALGRLKHSISRRTNSVCEGPIEIDLVEEVVAPYLVEAFCSQFSLALSDNGLLLTEVWQAMKPIHAPACNLDPAYSLELERNARDAVEKLRAPILKSEKARMGRSLREAIFGGWQDSQDVDHSLCPAIKMIAHQLVDLQQVLVECIEYFSTGGRRHIANIQQLSADMNSDDPYRSRKAAARVLYYLLEGYRLCLATHGRSFWRRTPESKHNFVNVSAAARNNGLYPNASALALNRGLESYKAIGLGNMQLELLGTHPILILFLELANFARWKIMDSCHGLPRRINIPGHQWSTIDEHKPVKISEEDWDIVERYGGFEDDNWIVVSKEGYKDGDCNVMEEWKSCSQGDVTVYMNKRGGELSNMPDGLPVAYNFRCNE